MRKRPFDIECRHEFRALPGGAKECRLCGRFVGGPGSRCAHEFFKGANADGTKLCVLCGRSVGARVARVKYPRRSCPTCGGAFVRIPGRTGDTGRCPRGCRPK